MNWSNSSAVGSLIRRLAKTFCEPDRITPSQWAEQRRMLSPESSAKRGGRFTFDLAPWQREVLDAVDARDTGTIVMMWASQVTGKTETLNNIIGHKIDVDPCPILMVQPTLEIAEAWSKDRLVPALRDTPSLRGKVRDARTRDSGNTILHKRFPGGHITAAGANSPPSLASRPIRLVLFDEVDRYPLSAGTEGDPIAIAQRRAESFEDAMFVLNSTPTTKGESRIERAYEESDKRQWFCPCPKCGHWQTLKWEQVKWEPADPSVNWIECENCKAHLTDDERRTMVRAGEWRATAAFNGTRGYHLNGICCLFRPQRRFRDRITQMIDGYLAAKGRKETLKVWTNTFLAQTWEIDVERVDMQKVMDRRETFGKKLPAQACLLTCACDVQADRIEGEVIAWGAGEESWGIERFQLYGSPLRSIVWWDLEKIRVRKWDTESGIPMGISALAIDSGGNAEGFGFAKSVYTFVLSKKQAGRGQSGTIAVKGSSTIGAPMAFEVMQKNGVNLLFVGTDRAKSTIFERLKLAEHGPGYMHFPMTYGEEFFSQLSAEELRMENRIRKWVKIRKANEALDIRVYSLALIDLLAPNWGALNAMFRVTSVPIGTVVPPAVGESMRAAAPVAPARRPMRRMPWRRGPIG